jgi:iron complex transport system substrate-binding protein
MKNQARLKSDRRNIVKLCSLSMVDNTLGLFGLTASMTAQAQPKKSSLPRLITIGGAITEMAYLLGGQDQLVGTDTTSVYPEAAQKTAKVGYLRQLSAEGLLSLKPDFIIASTEAGPPVVLDQIRGAGVKLELIDSDHSWNEVLRKLRAVGMASGRIEEAKLIENRLNTEWQSVQNIVSKSTSKKPRVLFILAHSQSPSVSGQQTAADALIQLMGGVNAMGGPNSFKGYRPMTAESMASAAPDFILTSTQGITAHGGIEKFWEKPELALTPAYKRRALIHMDASKMLGFGPRLPEAVRELHAKVMG